MTWVESRPRIHFTKATKFKIRNFFNYQMENEHYFKLLMSLLMSINVSMINVAI